MRITTQPLKTDGLGWLAVFLIAAPTLFILYVMVKKNFKQWQTSKKQLDSRNKLRERIQAGSKADESEALTPLAAQIETTTSAPPSPTTPPSKSTRNRRQQNKASLSGHASATLFGQSKSSLRKKAEQAETPRSGAATSDHEDAHSGDTLISSEDSPTSAASSKAGATSTEAAIPEISFVGELLRNMHDTLEALKNAEIRTLSPEEYAVLTRIYTKLREQARTRKISFEGIDNHIERWNTALNTFALKQGKEFPLYSFLQSCYLHRMKAEDRETLDQFNEIGICSGQGTYYLYEDLKNKEVFASDDAALSDFDIRIDVEDEREFLTVGSRIKEKFSRDYRIICPFLPDQNICSITLEPRDRSRKLRKIDLTIYHMDAYRDSQLARINNYYLRFSNVFVQSNGKLTISHEQMKHILLGTPMIDVNLDATQTIPLDVLRAFLFKTVFRFRDSILEGKIILSDTAKEEITKLLVAYKHYNEYLKANYFPSTDEYDEYQHAIATTFRKYNMRLGADARWYRPQNESWIRVNPKEYCDLSRIEDFADKFLATCRLSPGRR